MRAVSRNPREDRSIETNYHTISCDLEGSKQEIVESPTRSYEDLYTDLESPGLQRAAETKVSSE